MSKRSITPTKIGRSIRYDGQQSCKIWSKSDGKCRRMGVHKLNLSKFYIKKGHNSNKNWPMNPARQYAQQGMMVNNPVKFGGNPMENVGEWASTNFVTDGRTTDGKDKNNTSPP